MVKININKRERRSGPDTTTGCSPKELYTPRDTQFPAKERGGESRCSIPFDRASSEYSTTGPKYFPVLSALKSSRQW